MSGKCCGWAYEQVTGSPTTKAVLAKLGDNANDLGIAWPSVKDIATMTELSESTVREHLRRLKDSGFIRVVGREGRDGKPKSNFYLLNVDWASEARQMEHVEGLEMGRLIIRSVDDQGSSEGADIQDVGAPGTGPSGSRTYTPPGAGPIPPGSRTYIPREPEGHIKNLQLNPNKNLAPVAARAANGAPPDATTRAWEGYEEKVDREFTPEVRKAWFDGSELRREEGRTVIVVFDPDKRAKRSWITNNFVGKLSRIFGTEVSVEIG
jgi:DNA-binding transcriptional ArsR family regulator